MARRTRPEPKRRSWAKLLQATSSAVQKPWGSLWEQRGVWRQGRAPGRRGIPFP